MKVSICVPVYGVEKYIEKCARSLFEQTYEDIEYVFIDDCSLDKSIDVLLNVSKDYPQREDKIVIVKHSVNEGVAIARNTAINNATGDFLYWVDPDDYIEKNTIECLMKEQNDSNADIVTGRIVINDNEKDIRFLEPMYENKNEMLHSILSNVWHHELINRLIRRCLFIDHNVKALPHVNVCEDWQIVPQLVYYARSCITLDKYLYHYIMNPDSITHSNNNWEKEKNGYLQEQLSLKVLIDFFKGTEFEKAINSLYCRRMAKNIDLGINNNDKTFFDWCRSNILSLPSNYWHSISRAKMLSIKMGYTMTRLFLFSHYLKENILTKNMYIKK